MKTKLVIITIGLFTAHAAHAEPRLDPSHVMGAKACTECHGKEVDAWRATKHFKTFDELENSDKAAEIADALGVDDFASDSVCIECHFTLQKKGAKTVAISGISCESCHGASKNWIKEHNKETLSRTARQAVSVKAGMIYPEDVYAVGRNCFDCHIVSREELVNKGGHPAFSENFDLYAWSQGEVRHSFMTDAQPVKKAGTVNRAADANRKRMLYMVGRLLHVEYSLRAMAKATTVKAKPPGGEKAYALQIAHRYDALQKKVAELNQLAPTPEVTEIVKIAKALRKQINVNRAKPLNAGADKISELAKKFAKNHDGSKLAAIDSQIPAPHGQIFKP